MEIVCPTRLPSALADALGREFRVHDLASALDREAATASAAAARALVCAAAILADGHPFFLDAALMTRFPKLEIVANLGVGYDNLDARWAGDHGIVVTNTPDVLTDEVADLAMGLLLATVREIPQADRYLRQGSWSRSPYRLTATLRGRTMGVVGLGRIGKAIAARAEAFGVRVLYHGRRSQDGVRYGYHGALVELARASDILMVVAPGGAETRRMIDRDVLKALGPAGVLVNVARGSLVDENALIEALAQGDILAAGLDVYANEPHVPPELISMDNVVLLPHVGSASRATREAMGRLVVDNLRSWAAGRGPLTPIAETPWPQVQKARRHQGDPQS